MKYRIEGFGGVKFWMQRLSEEHSKIAKQKLDRINDLFFQSYNFDNMGNDVKEKVIQDILADIKELFGEEEFNRIKNEYFGD